MKDPGSLNLYGYCEGNPVMSSDPTGHRTTADDGSGSWAMSSNGKTTIHDGTTGKTTTFPSSSSPVFENATVKQLNTYLSVRSCDSNSAKEIGKIFGGERVQWLRDGNNGYCYVRYHVKDGSKEGWVHSQYLVKDHAQSAAPKAKAKAKAAPAAKSKPAAPANNSSKPPESSNDPFSNLAVDSGLSLNKDNSATIFSFEPIWGVEIAVKISVNVCTNKNAAFSISDDSITDNSFFGMVLTLFKNGWEVEIGGSLIKLDIGCTAGFLSTTFTIGLTYDPEGYNYDISLDLEITVNNAELAALGTASIVGAVTSDGASVAAEAVGIGEELANNIPGNIIEIPFQRAA